ncbi:MAG: zinc ribbon domain-containing protein, partial [Pseudomonadota bacterium]
MSEHYLATGLPQPVASELDGPYWEGLQQNVLRLQQCQNCQGWQWGPEHICHHCHSDQLAFVEVAPVGEIYSYERVWHPVHPALAEQG